MFTFTNPLMLWAAPVLLLPWIFRRRREERIQRVDFALLRFLWESEQKELMNPYLQEWLLLLLRTLLLALLLFALSGPKWIAEGGYGGGFFSYLPFGRTFQSHVLILDTSYSMGYGEGENSWWKRAEEAWNEAGSAVGGMTADRIRWDQSVKQGSRLRRLRRLNPEAFRSLFSAVPQEPGAPFADLFASIRESFSGSESFLLVTDGQRYPWRELLDSPGGAAPFPSMVAVTVGGAEVENSWCEISAISSPPWGVSGWETIAGRIRSIHQADSVSGSVSIYPSDSDECLFERDFTFPAALSGPVSIPFLYSGQYSDWKVTDSPEQPELSLSIRVEPNDPLPLDNEMTVTIPCLKTFTFALFCDPRDEYPELSALRAVIDPLAGESAAAPVRPVYVFPPEMNLPESPALAILSPRLSPWWSPAETSWMMDAIKNGGSAIVFTGSAEQRQGAWDAFLQELGWSQWETVDENAIPGAVHVASSGLLGQALAEWDPLMWNTWIPSEHGALEGVPGRGVVTYSIGERTAHLIAEIRLGEGSVWIVNTSLSPEAEILLSPLFPVFLWETAKEVIRSDEAYDLHPPSVRDESDLTLLTEEEKAILSERYGIRFAELETMREAISAMKGGTDLRMAVLFLCLIVALAESWLANRLASV